MSLRLEGLIEHWPERSVLYVRALPGYQVAGSNAIELQARAGAVWQAHLDWLVRHELIDAPSGPVDLSVVEQLPSLATGVGPRFAADLPAPDDAEIEAALAVGRAALSDLIDAADVADPALATRVLRGVALADRWYRSRLTSPGPSESSPADPVDAVIDAAGAFEDAVDAHIANLEPELSVQEGEEWTLAKILRRRTGQLTERLSDLLPRSDHE